jgi:hypothetical protein
MWTSTAATMNVAQYRLRGKVPILSIILFALVTTRDLAMFLTTMRLSTAIIRAHQPSLTGTAPFHASLHLQLYYLPCMLFTPSIRSPLTVVICHLGNFVYSEKRRQPSRFSFHRQHPHSHPLPTPPLPQMSEPETKIERSHAQVKARSDRVTLCGNTGINQPHQSCTGCTEPHCSTYSPSLHFSAYSPGLRSPSTLTGLFGSSIQSQLSRFFMISLAGVGTLLSSQSQLEC